MKKSTTVFYFLLMLLGACQDQPAAITAPLVEPTRQKPSAIVYQMQQTKEWLKQHTADSLHHMIAYAVNRTDQSSFEKMDSVMIPTDLSGDLVYYLPFPLSAPFLRDVHKIIFFSYLTQTFATYENGLLTYTGPTSLGRKKDRTPTGLFYANWKAEETTSTFNDEWELRWNVNILNKEGIGWHQYSLPGYPASHSCLRLLEKDAQHLYQWVDQWELEGTDSVLAKGTPVIVFGEYDFDAPKPWLQLLTNPRGLDITSDDLEEVTMSFLPEIVATQKNTQALQAKRK